MEVTIPMQVLVCLGLLYRLIDRILFCSGVIKVSENSMKPSGLVSSTMNLIAWSLLLTWCRKFFVFSVCYITKVSSTILFHNLGRFSAVLRVKNDP